MGWDGLGIGLVQVERSVPAIGWDRPLSYAASNRSIKLGAAASHPEQIVWRVMLVMMYGNVLTSGARESRGGGAAREKPERSQGSSTEWRAGEDEQEMKRTSEQGRCWRPGMRPMRSHRWFVGWFG
ncbi:hypothetical protein HL42_8209 [Trichophyton rubrum]|nr:hypothetical protein HL42_8209 [Trichophyton rubrum]